MASDPIRRIGVLTGGGDCPGLNAVIRAVTKEALGAGLSVVGIEDGFLGLIENRLRSLSYDDVSNILTLGGTILGTSNKANPERYAVGRDAAGQPRFENVVEQCLGHAEQAGLDALVVIGGDGTMACAQPFSAAGLTCIGLPKTIDNDILHNEVSFGFQTAVATATEALDRVHTTAASHHRAIAVELMGRNAGWLTLAAGIASGADVLLLPELPFEFDVLGRVCEERARRGRRFTILAVAEGARPRGGERIVRAVDPTSPDPIRLGGIAKVISDWIDRETEVEARHVVLGHIQRGGSPISADRLLGTQLGHHGVRLLLAGKRDRMVVVQNGRVHDIPLADVAGGQRLVPLDHPLIGAARGVRTSFGVAE
jgi:ATP-dependent phosphofructokinase / diphosphate-dependent phosphofructokinase